MSILRRRSASRFGSLRFWCSGPCHRTNWLRVDSMCPRIATTNLPEPWTTSNGELALQCWPQCWTA